MTFPMCIADQWQAARIIAGSLVGICLGTLAGAVFSAWRQSRRSGL